MASSEKIIRESSNFLLGASLDSGTADSVGTSFTACGASVVTVSVISVWISSTSVPSVATTSVASIGFLHHWFFRCLHGSFCCFFSRSLFLGHVNSQLYFFNICIVNWYVYSFSNDFRI